MNWKKVDIPKKKSDWRYKFLRLREIPHSCRRNGEKTLPPLPVKPGDTAQIYMRRDISEVTWWVPEEMKDHFGKRVLEIIWNCPHCDHPHHLIIPESWIAEGKAEFVEAEK